MRLWVKLGVLAGAILPTGCCHLCNHFGHGVSHSSPAPVLVSGSPAGCDCNGVPGTVVSQSIPVYGPGMMQVIPGQVAPGQTVPPPVINQGVPQQMPIIPPAKETSKNDKLPTMAFPASIKK